MSAHGECTCLDYDWLWAPDHHPLCGLYTRRISGATEDDLRAAIAANPYFGEWDEWAPIAYNRIPVMARAVMSHVYGRHDDSPHPYEHCVLCYVFRERARQVDGIPILGGQSEMHRLVPLSDGWRCTCGAQFAARREWVRHRSMLWDEVVGSQAAEIERLRSRLAAAEREVERLREALRVACNAAEDEAVVLLDDGGLLAAGPEHLMEGDDVLAPAAPIRRAVRDGDRDA